MRDRPLRRHGPKPTDQVRVTAEFHEAIRASGHAIGALATVGGFRRLPHLSYVIYADHLPLTPLLQRRLTNIATALHFPTERMLEKAR